MFRTSKIRFWKQFTTCTRSSWRCLKLCFGRQRYDFESNSQLWIDARTQLPAVFRTSKIRFWKQFTTAMYNENQELKLCFGRQRYDFESNSQHNAQLSVEKLRCVSDVKDTILKAIHNIFLCHNLIVLLCFGRQRYDFESNSQRHSGADGRLAAVFRTSKIRFWKQFTTVVGVVQLAPWLCFGRQRYDFESNSQRNLYSNNSLQAVFRTSKIRFWKQFTTYNLLLLPQKTLCFGRQRYDFESNSQRFSLSPITAGAVFRTSKIRFWKQFTTFNGRNYAGGRLCFGRQRYDFESNSQQHFIERFGAKRCVSDVKDTILKAIHNKTNGMQWRCLAVFRTSKIRFWKQFTTIFWRLRPKSRCVSDVKDTILKAIHNVCAFTHPRFYAVFRTSKIRFWKQFTTPICSHSYSVLLCFGRQRYDFESNSQQVWSRFVLCPGCVSDVKDTILKAIHDMIGNLSYGTIAVFRTSKIRFWKQFTTTRLCDEFANLLCFGRQRYDFERNSQLPLPYHFIVKCCVSDVKDTILKAIHNMIGNLSYGTIAVFRTSKIRFWKQFTTALLSYLLFEVLCFGRQRYDFESNSQLIAIWLRLFNAVFRTSKIRFWKQFTTAFLHLCKNSGLCFGRQRYDFESNSQPVQR